jgi:hypothetical protein
MVTFWLAISIVSHFGWKVYQIDVKSSFLNGDLDEGIYMVHPQGFQVPKKKHMIF